MMNIWKLCQGENHIRPICAKPWRVIEAQHVLSARDLVDSTAEHDLLEELLEQSKPLIEKAKNYLIYTPFRYPPLKYGSRFGRIYEPSLWYGSCELETAFSEVAYYKLKFLKDTTADLGYLEIAMTAFSTSLTAKRGIDLTISPFNEYFQYISNKNTHDYSQPLGSAMRDNSIEAFVYFSARNKNIEKNIAAFQPSVFQMKNKSYILNQQTWMCIGSKKGIEFIRLSFTGKQNFVFPEEYFS